ncbi:MAG: amino acid adenylation domain-containing protein, partial [bacterium]|nr:amino acid adenylation domain-containing protein [bacterium]
MGKPVRSRQYAVGREKPVGSMQYVVGKEKPVGSRQYAVGKEKIKDNKTIKNKKETIEDKESTIREKTTSIQQPASSTPSIPSFPSTKSTKTTQLTYRELNKKSNQLAAHIIQRGVKPGMIVAIMAERTSEMIIGLLGILKAGAAYLPIDTEYPEERINYMLKDSNTRHLLKATGEKQEIGTLDEGIDKIEIQTIEKHNPFTQTQQPETAAPTGIAYIIYTSGSTGQPKGVMVEHTPVVNFIYSLYREFDKEIGSRDNCLSVTDMSFDVSVCEFFLPLGFGATLEVLPKETVYEVRQLAGTIAARAVTYTYMHPGLLKELCLELEKCAGRLDLNKMLVGVEPIRDHQLESYMNLNLRSPLRIVNGYGPTETTICATTYRYTPGSPEGRKVPIGTPLDNAQVFLLDKNGNLQPQGVAGELHIGGDGLARGYLNRPELTANRFTKAGWQTDPLRRKGIWQPQALTRPTQALILYKTGDLARRQPDGNIEFLGRIDHQVKIRGYRIELGEIEARLLTHPEIKEAVVITRQTGDGDNILC